MIVVDTSILSLVYRRKRGAPFDARAARFVELVEADAQVVLPSIVLQEILSGVRDDESFSILDDVLGGFPLLVPTRSVHVRAARLRSECARRGVAASTVDVLVAAHALEVDGALFTADEDFERIAMLCALRLYDAR